MHLCRSLQGARQEYVRGGAEAGAGEEQKERGRGRDDDDDNNDNEDDDDDEDHHYQEREIERDIRLPVGQPSANIRLLSSLKYS